jgi:hypothetical protein
LPPEKEKVPPKIDFPETARASDQARKVLSSIDFAGMARAAAEAQRIFSSGVFSSGATALSSPISTIRSNQDRILQKRVLDLENEKNKLRQDLLDLTTEVRELTDSNQKQLEIIIKYQEIDKLSYLVQMVKESAANKFFESEDFLKSFTSTEPCRSYILSIDIRRSTDLMLKSRSPQLFAEFMSNLAVSLREIIIDNYGVFDKFTGDGILAFFPEFYSGPDAALRTIMVSSKCHEVFGKHYKENRHCFNIVVNDTGLGIGIDYGFVQLVRIGGSLTVVGTAVVYACRMSGAEAGRTYVNQSAYEELFNNYSAYCDFDEYIIDIKHEGKIHTYNSWFAQIL